MDRVRFGRALGMGARDAAKALLKAADAAAAPTPAPVPRPVPRPAPAPVRGQASAASPQPAAPAQPAASPRAAARAGQVVGRRIVAAKATTAGAKRGGKRFGEAIWGPLARHSGVLWLEFTGVFFGLFALSATIGVWKNRAALLAGGSAAGRVWFAVGIALVFGYFTVTSFVRARRRGRQ